MNQLNQEREIWFVYDGDCPLCKNAALALRIKREYGVLNLLNARESLEHPLIQEISKRAFDLDEGMIIYDGSHYYHGKEALRFMSRYGEYKGLFNLFNKSLFWSDNLSRLSYPWMRGVRNLLIRKSKTPRIDNLNLKSEPIFKGIFGNSWNELPPVMHRHYLNRPYSDDVNTVEGVLDVMCAGPLKLLSPLFWVLGGIPPQNESNVPVTVRFESSKDTKEFIFKRVFNFKNRKPYHFKSRMIQIVDNEVIEIMRFGVGWRMTVHWEEGYTKLKHKGYVLRLLGHFIPIPLTMLLGEGNAWEKAVDESSFDMQVEITHPWWGKIYGYKGRFWMRENS